VSHDWQQTCQCGEAVQCPGCKAAWVVGFGPEPPHATGMKLEELPEDTLVADGFEDALVGFGWRLNTPIAIYDRDKAVQILVREMTEEEADEYISFNVEGAYVGEGTPLFVTFEGAENT